MERWRAADEQPVATRHAVAVAISAVADEVVELARLTGTRPLVVACWQHEEYVGSPLGLPTGLATVADVVVACVGRPSTPDDVDHVELDEDEPLAAEWSLTAVTPVGGLSFVAREVGATLPAATVERGRAYRWDLTIDPLEVIATTRRLLRDIESRTPPSTLAALQATTTALADDVAAELEERARRGRSARPGASGDVLRPAREEPTALLGRIVTIVEEEGRSSARRVSPPSGGDLGALSQWLTDAGPRAPTLGMVVARCAAGGAATTLRAKGHALFRDGDLVVDVPPDAVMLVLPHLTGAALALRAEEVRRAIASHLHTEVTAIGVEVPAVEARHDLVGSLGRALSLLRTGARGASPLPAPVSAR